VPDDHLGKIQMKNPQAKMNSHFAQITEAIPELFAALAASEPFILKRSVSQMRKAGVYAFFEDGRPVHVGRTRNLQERLRGHITKNQNSATFAFKRTRRALGISPTYKKIGSRAQLTNDGTFGPEFTRQIACVKAMEVRFVETPDPVTQYLLELYAHVEWNLPLDEFENH
jgi:hypothetical protein